MRYFPSFAAAAAAVAVAATAIPASAEQAGTRAMQLAQTSTAADCQILGQDFDERVMGDPDLRGQFGAQVTQDLRQLRNAAMQLERYGQIEACGAVAAAIHEISQNPGQYATGAPGQPGATDQATDPALMDRDQMLAQDREAALPYSEMRGRLRLGELIGADVRGINGESIGEVDDILMGDDTSTSYLIVAYGGFLGFGSDLSAVPLEQVQISQDLDSAYVPLSAEDLDAAPTFSRGDEGWLDDADWQERNRQFYSGTR